MLFLLVKFPDGTMAVRPESDADAAQLTDGSRYMMFDGKEGVVVQDILNPDNYSNPDDYRRALKLLEDIASTVFVAKGKSTKSGMEVLGTLLREVHVHAVEEERNKWMKEKEELLKGKKQILEEYNATLKRNVKNLSICTDVILDLRAENGKLKRKHKKATALIRAVVEAFRAIGMDVEFVVDDGAEVPATPSEQLSPQSVPPATGEIGTPSNPDPKSVETEG